MPYLDSLIPSLPFQASDTSREAAVAIQPKASSQRAQVLAFYRVRGSSGATDRELAFSLGIARQSLCPRRRELIAQGLVVGTGRKRAGCEVFQAVEG